MESENTGSELLLKILGENQKISKATSDLKTLLRGRKKPENPKVVFKSPQTIEPDAEKD